jgi:hypothetical protein
MKKITVVTGLCLALLVPAVALAKATPNAGDKRAAKSECNMLRGHSHATREAFQAKFDTFKACVKKKAAEEAQEAQNAHTNAAKECAAERAQDRDAFAEKYGTNDNDRNAFGKCVSTLAKQKEHAADEQDKQDATEFKNAAKECASERSADAEAFKTKYGTERSNFKNAFGKCVSQKVREDNEEPETEQPTS